jgi:hypothetical protein
MFLASLALNGSLRRLEFSEPLLGVHPAFDRVMILLQDIVYVLDCVPSFFMSGIAEP